MFSWKAALPLRSPSLLFIVQLRNHQALVKHDPARAGLCPPSATGAANMVFKIFWSFEPRYHGNDIKKNRSLDPLEIVLLKSRIDLLFQGSCWVNWIHLCVNQCERPGQLMNTES